jgi:hypothetical protein
MKQEREGSCNPRYFSEMASKVICDFGNDES